MFGVEIERRLFSSRIARRIFLVFVVGTLLPLIATTVLAYVLVSRQVEEQATTSLRSASKDYGLDLHNRLKNSKEHLLRLGDILGDRTDEETIEAPHLFEHFSSVYVSTDGGSWRHLHGDELSSENIDSIAGQSTSLESALVYVERTGRDSEISIRVEAGSEQSTTVLLGTLDSKILWVDEITLDNTHFCVFSNDGDVLHCQGRIDPNLLASHVDPGCSAREITKWKQDNSEYLSNCWNVFLEHEFKSGEWTVVGSQNMNVAFSSLGFFRSLFGPLIAMSFLLVILMSLILIRRNLTAIDTLIRGTEVVSDQDFSVEIDVQQDDEFGVLADAFNGMTRKLRTMFNKERILAKLDQQILTNQGLEDVSDITFKGLSQCIQFDSAALISIPDEEPTHIELYFSSDGTHDSVGHDVAVSQRSLFDLASRGAVVIDGDDAHYSLITAFYPVPSRYFFSIPVSHSNKPNSLIVLGFNERPEPDDEVRSHISHVIDRVSVALSAFNHERLLDRQANFDTLTGISNRNRMQKLTDQAIQEAQTGGNCGAFCFIDLDRFKNVNDAYGHPHGDELLCKAALRISSTIDPTHTASRFGGDEFTILMPEVGGEKEALEWANKIVEALSQPYEIRSRATYVGASIGITLFPENGKSFDEALRFSDTAMYRAKDSLEDHVRVYHAGMSEMSQSRASLERDLHYAVEHDQIELAYQPIFDLASGALMGFESLFRWSHPEHAYIPPAKAISVAENTDLILKLGSKVLNMALQQWSAWHLDDLEPGTLAVNVSPRQILDEAFLTTLKSALGAYRIPSHLLELEVTEDILIEEPDKAAHRLELIHEMGVHLSIDDFGKGYSSLSYLTRLPLDVLKIDRSFVLQLDSNPQVEGIISTIISLSHHLGMKVVAEGVETDSHLQTLKRHGCDSAQGYLLGKPMPAKSATILLARKKLISDNDFHARVNQRSFSTPG